MMGFVTRVLERRRAIRETVTRLREQMEAGAWAHARDRAYSAATPDDEAFWRKVQVRIEALDDHTTRMSVRRRRRR